MHLSTLIFFCQMQSFALPNPIFLHMQLPCWHSFIEKFLYQRYEVLFFKTIYLKLANLVHSLCIIIWSRRHNSPEDIVIVQLSAIWSKVDIVFTTGPVRLAEKPWLKVLFSDLLWEKRTVRWLKKYGFRDKRRLFLWKCSVRGIFVFYMYIVNG
jgi:hypothetical protein